MVWQTRSDVCNINHSQSVTYLGQITDLSSKSINKLKLISNFIWLPFPKGECELNLSWAGGHAGIWGSRESVNERNEISRGWYLYTFLLACPSVKGREREQVKERRASLMWLADAFALLQNGDLDILHILRYKYPPDVYYSH